MEDSDHQYGAFIGSNEDLLTEILIRLPVTSILRFKSVSKHWRSLLTHTHFTHLYDNLLKTPGFFARAYLTGNNSSKFLGIVNGDLYVPFDVENHSPPPFRSLDFYFNRSHVTIVQSCNGLLLCYAFHNGDIEYYVFNPTTKQLAFIPSVPKYVLSMALAFHQTHCMHYKVVSVCPLKPRRKNMFQIQVYSSNTGKWKICIESFSAHISEVDRPVYCNGAVYFAPKYCKGCNFVCLKFEAEQLQTLPLPVEMISSETTIMYFGESRGHLHLISYTHGEEYLLHVNVFEMLTDHSGWFVKYRVQLDGLLRDFLCVVSQYDFKVVDVVRGKEEEDTFLVLSSNGKMIRYNVHKKSFKELYRYDNDNLHLSGFYRYVETLSSL